MRCVSVNNTSRNYGYKTEIGFHDNIRSDTIPQRTRMEDIGHLTSPKKYVSGLETTRHGANVFEQRPHRNGRTFKIQPVFLTPGDCCFQEKLVKLEAHNDER